MTSARTPSAISFCVALAAWWVETTIASMRLGLPYSYSTVTCVLPSGRRNGSLPFLRTSASFFASRFASEIVSGMSSGVSRQAKPIIMPWSPAPCTSNGSVSAAPSRCSSEWLTPAAMSGDCSFR